MVFAECDPFPGLLKKLDHVAVTDAQMGGDVGSNYHHQRVALGKQSTCGRHYPVRCLSAWGWVVHRVEVDA